MVLICPSCPVDPKTRRLSIPAVVKKKTGKYLAVIEVTNWFILYVVVFVVAIVVVSNTGTNSKTGSSSSSSNSSVTKA
jgi:hypothetical protein